MGDLETALNEQQKDENLNVTIEVPPPSLI